MTVLDKIDRLPDGTVLVRFVKPDGGYHRTSISPGVDPHMMLETVSDHLQQMGHLRISAADAAKIHAKVRGHD